MTRISFCFYICINNNEGMHLLLDSFKHMCEYNKQATEFLEKTNTIMSVEFLKNDYHFQGDNSKRDIYKVTFTRGQRNFSLNFGQSMVNSSKIVNKLTKEEFTLSGQGLNTNKRITVDVNKYINGFNVGEVIEVKGVKPTAYDVLACLQKYDVGTFENFCDDFGYDLDSKTADRIYNLTVQEYKDVCRIWTDEEIELLQEIN